MTETANNNLSEMNTPGQILRAHREKMELSIDEIAKRVHLDIKIIESIENDSQEGMPTTTYVRGYLRSYAKMVGADADRVIELYDSDSPAPPPEILPEVKPPTQVSSSDKPVKAFTYLLTLGLVLLLLIWYQSNFVVDTPTNDGSITNNSETTINGVDITYKIVHHPDSWQIPVNNTETGMDTLIQTNLNDTLELQTDGGEQSIGIIPIEEMNDAPTSSTSGQGPDSIKLTVTRDSWVEIYDKDNKRLFLDLALAGEQHMIKGIAPFTVLLGFSNGVSVEFNGNPFDTTPFSNNGIARFTLSEQ